MPALSLVLGHHRFAVSGCDELPVAIDQEEHLVAGLCAVAFEWSEIILNDAIKFLNGAKELGSIASAQVIMGHFLAAIQPHRGQRFNRNAAQEVISSRSECFNQQ